MKHYIGLDIGGTAIKYAVIHNRIAIAERGAVQTPKGTDSMRIANEVTRLIAMLLEKYDSVHAVGISTAGVVDAESGEIIFAGPTIPAYQGTNLKQIVENTFHKTTLVINDVNAAALGEKWIGAGRNYDHLFCVTIGTGIGGALICNNQLVVGSHNRAGEIGHFLFDKQSQTTFEERASMTALLKKAFEAFPLFSGDGRELFAMAKEGNQQCITIIDDWSEEVAKGLAAIICLVDPKLILIGGGVSEQGDFLIQMLKRHVREYLPEHFSRTELKAAKLGNDAALFGAVYPFFEH